MAALPSDRYTSRCVGAGVDRCVDAPRQTIAVQRRSAAEADTEPHLTGGDARQPSILQFLRRAMHECESRHHDAASERCEGCRSAQSLRRHRGIQNTKPGAAEALRHQQSGNAKLDQALPQCGVEAGGAFRMAAQCLDRYAIGQQAAQRIRKEALFLAEGEFHQALATFGSRGRSRPRSEMMFFWMLFEPPPIISPTS
jgi:hypothetical protein